MSFTPRISLAFAFCALSYANGASAQASPAASAPVETPLATLAVTPGPGVMAPQPVPQGGMVTVTSAGEPVEVALVPLQMIVPPDPFIQWSCRTPCTLPAPLGFYHLVARSSGGRLLQTIEVRPGVAQYRVSPRGSRGLGIALLATGGGLAILGVSFLLVGLEFSAYTSIGVSINPVPYYAVGGVALAVGVALLVPGVLSLRGSGGRVEQVAGNATRRRGLALAGYGAAPLPGGGMAGIAFTF